MSKKPKNPDNPTDESTAKPVNESHVTEGLRREIEVRKEMESRLLVAMEVAEAASAAKSEFLANVSHELRTPMTAIIASVQLLEDYITDRHLRDILEIVMTSSTSMMSLINNLLDFAKSEAGRVRLEDNVFDVQEAVIESLKPYYAQAKKQNLQLHHHVELPDFNMVIGDVARLQQILGHLVDNALKFTTEGEVECHVGLTDPNGHGLSVKPGCECLHFSVRDTGAGIPTDHHLLIFEPFTQVDGAGTRRYNGGGLGLAITQQLVEMMDGKIWVESEIGNGSTFHFIVQLRAAKVMPVPGPSQ
jgi:signal transduction histidine kinase